MNPQSEKNRKFDALGLNEQANVLDLRKALFGRWPTPVATAEAKADWDDDMALLYVDFGWACLDGSLTWHRQNTERRPSIPAIREQCRAIRERAGRRTSSADIEHNEYLAQVREAANDPFDNRFTPVALIIRDTRQRIALKAKAKAAGQAIDPADLAQCQAWRDRTTDDEWRELRQEGVRDLRMRGMEEPSMADRLKRSRSDEGMSPVSETVSR